jgi:spore coat polysaccharide biosynthesis protein SpsF (cytidylyltransferase family)
MLAFIQARSSSNRLPGKVLRPIAGRPMLGWVIERVRSARLVTDVRVATSVERSDDVVAAHCQQQGVGCFRGSLNDVAGRLMAAAEQAKVSAFVRVSGDSPLMVPGLVDDVIALFQSAGPDLATNVRVRTFPKGLSVEVIALDALRRAHALMRPGEEEHVTGPFYRCPEQFRIADLTSGHDWGAVQLSVDTEEDFVLIERILQNQPSAPWRASVADLIDLRQRCLAREPI